MIGSGSQLTRLLNCPASAVLPRAEVAASAWADAGHVEHEQLAHATLTGTHETARRTAVIPPNPRVEVKLAYDIMKRTARILGDSADRNYGSPAEHEIVMQLDVLGIDERDRVVVIDWKTGYADVEPAATNGQLWGGALAACRALGKTAAVVMIVYTNQGDRVDACELDALDLADFAERLQHLAGRIASLRTEYKHGGVLSTAEGTWCKYCSSKHVCPSKNAALAQIAAKGLAIQGAEMTPERLRTGYAQLVTIEQMIKTARDRLNRYAEENGPIDLGDGRMYGRYQRRGARVYDPDVVYEVMREQHGQEAADHAVTRKVVQKKLDEALKLANVSNKAASRRAIDKEVEARGGLSHKADSFPIGEFLLSENEPAQIDLDAIDLALESA